MTRSSTRQAGCCCRCSTTNAVPCRHRGLVFPFVCTVLLLHCVVHAVADTAAITTEESTPHDTPGEQAASLLATPVRRGLPLCGELDVGSAASASATTTAGGVHCALPHISPDVAGSLPADLLRRATSPEVQQRTLVWQLGPPATAQHGPLHSSFAMYFRNVSTGNDDDDDEVDAANQAPRKRLGLVRLSRRLSDYNRLHGTALSSTSDGTDATRKRRRRRRRSSWMASQVDAVKDAAQSVTRAVSVAVHATDVTESARRVIAEVTANARDFAWWTPAAWRRLYSRQTVVVRFPLATWARSRHDAYDEGEEGDVADDVVADTDVLDGVDADVDTHKARMPMMSRHELAARASLALLRIISFPPVAQITTTAAATRTEGGKNAPHTRPPAPPSSSPSTVAYVCDLAGIDAAAQLVAHEAARDMQRREASAAAAAAAEQRGYASSSAITRSLTGMLSFLFHAFRVLVLQTRVPESGEAGELGASSWPWVGEGRRQQRTPGGGGGSALFTTRGSAAVPAALEFARRTREELGPYQPYGDSVLPVVLQELLGTRAVHTRMRLLEVRAGAPSSDAQEEPTRVELMAEWTASLPASTPVCLAFIALPPTSSRSSYAKGNESATTSSAGGGALPLSLSETRSLDVLWMQLMVLTWVLWQLERRVAQSAVVRHVVTGLTGMVVLTVLLLFYVVRHVQKMAVGQAFMLLAALLVCGSVASAEGILTYVWHSYALDAVFAADAWGRSGSGISGGGGDGAAPDDGTALLSGPLLITSAVLLFLCVVSGSLLHWLLPPTVLRAITRWCVRGLLVLLWWLCVRRNAEATVVTALLWMIWPPRVLRVAGAHLAWLVAQPTRLRTFAAAPLASPHAPAAPYLPSNDPVDDFPPAASQACGYVRPLATSTSWSGDAAGGSNNIRSYASLGSAEARLRQYEQDGAAHTRRALEELAAHLRANPGRYTTRLRDPNGVQRWAGDADDANDDGDAE